MVTHVDYWYDRWLANNTSKACILRVTNQCNERCTHCCFRSGPECVGQMSVKTCEEINTWVPARIILNIMGGEFTILDNYQEMLIALARNRRHIRLVTNGFWSNSNANSSQFLFLLEELVGICKIVDVAVSADHWHKSFNNEAKQLLDENDSIGIDIISTSDLFDDDIRPLGRAWDNKIIPREKTHRPCEIMSNMIITENGMIHRCPFGYFPWKHFSETTWDDAQEYIWGWRSEKLAEGMNCHLCMEAIQRG